MTYKSCSDIVLCRRDPWFFVTEYVFTLDSKTGISRFPDYNYIKELIQKFMESSRLVILKSRQMMVTWSAVAFALWEAIFPGSSDIMFLSKREDDAREAIRRIRFIFDHLPEFMKPRIGENTKFVLEFPDRNSRLMALPTHPHIGRTYSPTRIIWDEMASTPHDDEMFAALQPSLDGGGYFIGISTSQGPLTKHADLYMNANSYGFDSVALHYSAHPDKNDSWCRQARRGMSDRQWEMEQEMSLELGGDRVFEAFQKQTHVTGNYDIIPTDKLYRSIDFGYHSPVVLWARVRSGSVLIFGEWIGEDETVSDMAKSIADWDFRFGLNEDDFEQTYCDPAGAAKSDLGISSLERLKSDFFNINNADLKISYRQSSIMAGVDLVREKLRNADGEINLQVYSGCQRIINDFGRYVKKTGSEEPKKDGVSDHTMDALRYLIVNLFQKERNRSGAVRPRISVFTR